MTLDDLSFAPGAPEAPRRVTAPESVLPGYLAEARRIVTEIEARPPAPEPYRRVSDEFERLRWFPLPHEAAAALQAAARGSARS